MNWLFCGGMYRSGSTLQYQIASEIIERFNLGFSSTWKQVGELSHLKERHKAYEGFIVFKTHVCTSYIRQEFLNQNAFGLYIFRDIRDVFVSTMYARNKTFKNLKHQKFLQHILEQYQLWINLPNMLITKYEDMINDMNREIIRIAHFLNVELPEQDIISIRNKYSFTAQKQRTEKIAKANIKYDPKHLLHHNHIRKGEVNQWKSELSKKQINYIQKYAKDWLESNGYELFF